MVAHLLLQPLEAHFQCDDPLLLAVWSQLAHVVRDLLVAVGLQLLLKCKNLVFKLLVTQLLRHGLPVDTVGRVRGDG